MHGRAAAQPLGPRRDDRRNVARLQDPTKGDVGIVRPQVDPKKGLVSGFDIERSAWLRRWGCTDIKDACAAACNSDSSVSSLHLWPSGGIGPCTANDILPPESYFALDVVPKAAARFNDAELAELKRHCNLAEASAAIKSTPPELPGQIKHQAESCSQVFLQSRAAWEPTDEAISLQDVFARNSRSFAMEAAYKFVENAKSGEQGNSTDLNHFLLAQGALDASLRYGQLSHPSGGTISDDPSALMWGRISAGDRSHALTQDPPAITRSGPIEFCKGSGAAIS